MSATKTLSLLVVAVGAMSGCDGEPPVAKPATSNQVIVLPTVSFEAPDKFDVPSGGTSSQRVKAGAKFKVEFPVKIVEGSTKPSTTIIKLRDDSEVIVAETITKEDREADGKTIYVTEEMTAPGSPGKYSLQAWNSAKQVVATQLIVE